MLSFFSASLSPSQFLISTVFLFLHSAALSISCSYIEQIDEFRSLSLQQSIARDKYSVKITRSLPGSCGAPLKEEYLLREIIYLFNSGLLTIDSYQQQ